MTKKLMMATALANAARQSAKRKGGGQNHEGYKLAKYSAALRRI